MPLYSDFVRDDYGRPISGATVKLFAIDGTTLIDTDTTGADGQFTVTGPDAKCVLQVSYGVASERSVVLVGNPPEYIGATGPANSTYATLAAMKAAPASNLSYILTTPNGPITYAYVAGDFTGKADDRYYVKLNAVPITTGALVRDSSVVKITDFGAKGNFIADDTDAIQAAIDYIALQPNGGVVTIPPGVFKLTYRPALVGGVMALILRNKVTLEGLSKHGSVLKLANGSIGPGTFGRIVISDPVQRISACGLHNFTVDGNRHGQGLYAEQGNGGNICLGSSDDISITEVASIGANGQGIQIASNPMSPVFSLLIDNCDVSDTAGSTVNADGTIALEYNGNGCGIQVSQVQNYQITNNRVRNCKDNGIDTYNESAGFTATGGVGIIALNTIMTCRCGIFPETTARVIVSTNYISGMVEAGIAVNRISSAPDFLSIINNTIEFVLVGVRVSGNAASIDIEGNTIGFITSATGAGVYLANASAVAIRNNKFKIEYNNVPLVAFVGAQGVNCRVTGNMYWNNPLPGYLCVRGATDMFGTIVDDFIAVSALSARTDGDGQFFRPYGAITNLASDRAALGLVGFNGATPRAKYGLPANPVDAASTQAALIVVMNLLKTFGLAE